MMTHATTPAATAQAFLDTLAADAIDARATAYSTTLRLEAPRTNPAWMDVLARAQAAGAIISTPGLTRKTAVYFVTF